MAAISPTASQFKILTLHLQKLTNLLQMCVSCFHTKFMNYTHLRFFLLNASYVKAVRREYQQRLSKPFLLEQIVELVVVHLMTMSQILKNLRVFVLDLLAPIRTEVVVLSLRIQLSAIWARVCPLSAAITAS